MAQLDQASGLVPNAEYWDTPTVVDRQRTQPYLFWYERELIRRVAADLVERDVPVRRVHVVGCGPGREVPGVCRAFPEAVVVASDIAPRMVEACAENLVAWGIADRVLLRCAGAAELRDEGVPAQVVLVLDNVLTYVTPAAERDETMRAFRALLAPGGVLGGVVHHRWGRLTKSAFFLRQEIADTLGIGREERGDRVARMEGMPVRLHYFTRDEVAALLGCADFGAVEVRSLAELGPEVGRVYHAATGYNNLVFRARAE